MEITVTNSQKLITIPAKQVRKLAHFFLQQGPADRRISWSQVSVVLVDDAGSQAINAAHLGHDYPTDVISFRYEPVPGEVDDGACGEIIVNVAMAIRIGPRWGGWPRELALYLAHGCDHLGGADDASRTQRLSMRRRERRWLALAREAGLGLDRP